MATASDNIEIKTTKLCLKELYILLIFILLIVDVFSLNLTQILSATANPILVPSDFYIKKRTNGPLKYKNIKSSINSLQQIFIEFASFVQLMFATGKRTAL